MKTYYLIYKTTNLVNNKIYIGCHKTNNLDDQYIGSGKILKTSIEKYGRENFHKEILEVFDNPDDMFEMESKLVNEDFVSRQDTYNVKQGGYGGWDYANETLTKEQRIKNGKFGGKIGAKNKKDKMKNDVNFYNRVCEQNKYASKMGALKRKELYPEGTQKGKSHTEESKRKISKANSIKQAGKNNSQYGTMWITNGKESKKIKKDQIIPEGWNKGRNIMPL